MQTPNTSTSFKDSNEATSAYRDNCMSLLEKHAVESNAILKSKQSDLPQEFDVKHAVIHIANDDKRNITNKNIMFLEDIQEALEEENVETYHVSFLEKTILNYQPVEMIKNLIKGKKEEIVVNNENMLTDAVVPRVFIEQKGADGKSQLVIPGVGFDASSDTPTITETSLFRRSLSLSDMNDIDKTKVIQHEDLNTPILPSTKFEVDQSTLHVDPNNTTKSSRYVLIRTVGRGTFAKVKLAKHLPTNKIVAIKIIDKTKLDRKVLSKITREVSLMKELSHPNIVKLLEVMENASSLYLVMEYASGGELFDYLVANGCMKEKEARIKFREMISAVQYCHSKFIVHRDLKAENMLLNQKMKIKIADFGFANRFDPGSTLSTFCGSPPYAAPEIFNGTKYIGPEVDVWALGVILFTLVSGRLPFDGVNVADLRDKVTNLRYELPYFISSDCENLLKKMLVVNVKDRATIDVIMQDNWVNGAGLPKMKCHKDKDFVICERRMQVLKEMGFTEADITNTFKEKKFNIIHATYVLLGHPKSEEAHLTHQTSRPSQADTYTKISGRQDLASIALAEGAKDRPSTQSLSVAPTVSLGQYFKNLFFKKNEEAEIQMHRDTLDTFSGSTAKELMKQYQNAMSHMTDDMISDPNVSIPRGTNQQAILATINQMSITKHHKAGMFVNNTIGTPTQKQIMENNQMSAPPIFGKTPRVSSKVTVETVNMGKFTVQNTLQKDEVNHSKKQKPDEDSVAPVHTKKVKEKKSKKNDESSSIREVKEKKKKHKSSLTKDTISEITTKMSETGWAKFDPKTKPCVANFVFSMNTVSTMHADLILLEVVRVLNEHKFSFEFLEKYLLLCHLGHKQVEEYGDSVQWEVEVCRIPTLFMNGVRMKRIFGSSFVYKKIGSRITKALKL